MKFFIKFIFIISLFFSTKLSSQIGVNTDNPNKFSDLHLASPNKALILNHVNDFSKITEPHEGMIVFDVLKKCFKGFANGVWTDCFRTEEPKGNPVIEVSGNGFVGEYTAKQTLTDQTFEVTISNNSFNEAKIVFLITDLLFDNSDIKVKSLHYKDPTNLSRIIDMPSNGLLIASGAEITLVFKLQGTILKPIKINAIWKKLSLEFKDSVDVKFKPDCNLGSFTTALSPKTIQGLINNQSYTATYSIPYTNADGYIFEAETQTINGITISRERSVGTSSGNLIYHIEGVFTGTTTDNVVFTNQFGCKIYVGDYLKNCNELLTEKRNLNQSISSGVYKIDPDGNGGIDPFKAYCDMETDNGGWTLLLNYLHKETTNPELKILDNKLPLQNGTTLGIDESGTENWGHAGVSLASKLQFSEIRMYGITSANNYKINFKTSLPNVIDYIKTGNGSMSNLHLYHDLLEGHTATLPKSANSYSSNAGDLALTYFPYWKSGVVIWSIRTPTGSGNPNRWEVEDYDFNIGTDTNSPATHHQVWIR